MHDCGKPRCRLLDEQGKVHFPDHANVTADLWLSIGGDPVVAELMRHDMDLHTMKAADIPEFLKLPKPAIATLLVSSLAEVHANASLFGGTNTPSFKAKLTQIERRGNAICPLVFGNS